MLLPIKDNNNVNTAMVSIYINYRFPRRSVPFGKNNTGVRQRQTFTARRGDNYYCCHYLAAGRSRRRLYARVELAWDFNVNYFRWCYKNKIKWEKKKKNSVSATRHRALPLRSVPIMWSYLAADDFKSSGIVYRSHNCAFCRSSIPSRPGGAN